MNLTKTTERLRRVLWRGLLLGATTTSLACSDSQGNPGTGETGGTEESTTEGGSASESTDDPVPTGLGCDITPECDKGDFVGSVDFTTAPSLQGEPALPMEEQIAAIQGYKTVSGYLQIHEADVVCLDFLACLEVVGHDVQIHGNPNLVDLSGLDALAEIGYATKDEPREDWHGTLTVSKNDSLKKLNGFNSLEQARQSLSISDNAELEAITGFTDFRAVQFDLSIRKNPNLVSLEGLSELAAVGGSFSVSNNPELCLSLINDLGEGLEQGPCVVQPIPPATCGQSTSANKTDC